MHPIASSATRIIGEGSQSCIEAASEAKIGTRAMHVPFIAYRSRRGARVDPDSMQTRNTLINEIDGFLEIDCCARIQRPNGVTSNKLVKIFVEF